MNSFYYNLAPKSEWIYGNVTLGMARWQELVAADQAEAQAAALQVQNVVAAARAAVGQVPEGGSGSPETVARVAGGAETAARAAGGSSDLKVRHMHRIRRPDQKGSASSTD